MLLSLKTLRFEDFHVACPPAELYYGRRYAIEGESNNNRTYGIYITLGDSPMHRHARGGDERECGGALDQLKKWSKCGILRHENENEELHAAKKEN